MINSKKPDTWLAQAGHVIDEVTGSVIPPMHTAATFARDENYDLRQGYMYSRYGNPTSDHAEKIVAELEGAADTLLFSSGLSAAVALFESLPVGAKIVAPSVMYFGVLVWMQRQAAKGYLHLSMFKPGDAASLEAAVGDKADLIWLETPANPDWSVTDIRHAADVARASGAKLVVDGTCASPLSTRALDLGADYAFHSATKYLNGHSDVTGGALSAIKTDPIWEDIREVRKLQGTILSGFESWLLIRGMRTLAIRWDKACENALTIARHFENHPKLDAVIYPGLSNHPGHATAVSQMTRGFGGMMSFRVKGGFDAAKHFATRTKIFLPATSLGGVESLIEHRKSIEGDATDVAPNLVRLSVGIEDADDLIADLEQALSFL
ncbi:MAG: aminotransferase class I/II-fold pyridoxal phosphate-dependent enzyme [Pseudomonadota bacterium]